MLQYAQNMPMERASKKKSSKKVARKSTKRVRTSKKTSSATKIVEPSASRVKYLLVIVGILIVTTGATYFLGISDSGQIEVDSAIRADSAERVERGEAPVETKRATIPNGGLVGQGVATPPPQESVALAVSASTSDDVASTTEQNNVEEQPEGDESPADADDSVHGEQSEDGVTGIE